MAQQHTGPSVYALLGGVMGVLASAAANTIFTGPLSWVALPLLLALIVFIAAPLLLAWRLKSLSGTIIVLGSAALAISCLAAYFYVFGPARLGIQTVEPQPVPAGDKIEVTVSGFDLQQADVYSARFQVGSNPPVPSPIAEIRSAADDVTLILQLPPSFAPPGEEPLVATVILKGPWPQGVWPRAETDIRILGRPVITSIDPPEGFRQQHNVQPTRVTIRGRNFDDRPGKTKVFFDSTEAPAEVTSDALLAPVPHLLTPGREYALTVHVGAGSSDPERFYVIGPPEISSIYPKEGFADTPNFPGTAITIIGSDLGSSYEPNLTRIMVGTVDVQEQEGAVQRNKAVFFVPTGAETGRIELETPEDRVFSEESFVVITARPEVEHVKPTQAKVESAIEIRGKNFGCGDPRANIVTLGPITMNVQGCDGSVSDATLFVVIPPGAEDGPVLVETPAGPSGPSEVIFIKPEITRVNPGSGLPDIPVTIEGLGFRDDIEVFFGDVQAGIQRKELDTAPQRIVVTVPQAVMNSPVRVRNRPSGLEAVTEHQFLVYGVDAIADYKTPPRKAYYEYGRLKMEFETDCEDNLVRYRRTTDEESIQDELDPLGICPIDLYVDKDNALIYVANHRSNAITVFRLPSLGFHQHIGTQTGPMRIEIAAGHLHAAGQGGIYRMYELYGRRVYREHDFGGEVLDMIARGDGEAVFVLVRRAGMVVAYKLQDGRVVEEFELGDVVNHRSGGDKIYVTNLASDSVTAFDTQSETTGEIPVGEGARPFGLAMDQERRQLYVTASGTHEVIVIDTERDEVVDWIGDVGIRPKGIGISDSFCRVAVISATGDGEGGLWLIDPETLSVLPEPIELGRPAAELSDVIFEGDKRVYVTTTEDGDVRRSIRAEAGCGFPIPRLNPVR